TVCVSGCAMAGSGGGRWTNRDRGRLKIATRPCLLPRRTFLTTRRPWWRRRRVRRRPAMSDTATVSAAARAVLQGQIKRATHMMLAGRSFLLAFDTWYGSDYQLKKGLSRAIDHYRALSKPIERPEGSSSDEWFAI